MKFTTIRTGDRVLIRTGNTHYGEHLFLGFTGMAGHTGVEPRFPTLAAVKLGTDCKSLAALRKQADVRGITLQARFLRFYELRPEFAFLDFEAIWRWGGWNGGGSVIMTRVPVSLDLNV